MTKIQLSDEDKILLIESINDGIEPSPDFIAKLFPGTAEKFDVKALDRAKIPTLEYAGKRTKAAILAEAGAGAGIGTAPLQEIRSFGETNHDEWKNMIVQGDNLQFLKTCFRDEDPIIKGKVKGKVKLIYIDPPFATESDFEGSAGERSYTDKIAYSEFVESMRERLIHMRELLHPEGSIFVHLDWKMSHYIKLVLDEIFDKSNFRNEIIWAYHGPGSPGMKQFNRKHDVIFWYTRSSKWEFNADQIKMPSEIHQGGFGEGMQRNDTDNYEQSGKVPEDWWEFAIAARMRIDGVIRAGYPTEKPYKLLERIIKATTSENDIVIDLFAGSGIVAAVSEVLNRRWIVSDFGKHSIYTIQKRILGISNFYDLVPKQSKERDALRAKYNNNPKPFSVISAGAYDFSRVMTLGNPEHKDAYISFVLGLFQLSSDEEKARKSKLTNIYAEKDGAPVEIFPVWDEHHLKNVKIDEDYLQSIITQGGGRLGGEYLIIAPEFCINIGDTKLKNSEGKEVFFRFLTFPYKVLEDVSRHLELHEQPASQGAVNELITSTAFYFNEDVEIEVVRDNAGLKITKFETKILNKEGNRFPGLDGLAMLLVDVDHEVGKPFDMDMTVFAKDISDDGVFACGESVDKKLAIIAIDKHGNESKPFLVTK